jgi:ABC-type nitrate/sulfonate/bicarbonate transport system ATPase subunit
MGRIFVKDLKKEYLNRRAVPRTEENSDLDLDQGQRIRVLSGITLEFCEGEMTCILGPSGCGKSTLLRIIGGFEKADSGAVIIDGIPVTGPSPDHMFVFQHNALLPWMTVWENVCLGVRHMTDRKAREKLIQEYIEMVELEGFEDRYPHQLSGGMLRRAELARALAVNPDTLFMDEPFTGLDFFTHMKMREEVVAMHEFIGKTIIMVTHDIDDALIMGDRIIVMSGRPSHIKMNRKLNFPRPRDFRKKTELNDLRNEIFLMMGVNYAV